MTEAEARNEFAQLRNDDRDFEKQYKKNEFWEWIKDYQIIIKK